MSLRALARVGRISNLPTVWSNIIAAAVFSCVFSSTTCTADASNSIGLALASISLLYIAGMFLNDAIDYPWDKQHNSARPLVNGEITVTTVWLVGGVSMLAAILLVWQFGNLQALLTSLAIAAIIILYNITHKRHPAAALLMGMARYGVYILTAALVTTVTPALMIVATAIMLYIAGLTLLARNEHENRLQHVYAIALLLAPFPVTLVYGYMHALYWAAAAIYLFALAHVLRKHFFAVTPNIRHGIGGLLAMIPLVDSLVAASVNSLLVVLLCLLIYIVTPTLHKYIAGT